MTRLRDAERELERLRSAQLLGDAGDLASGAEDVGGAAYVPHRVPDGTPADGLRKVALDIRGRLAPERPGVVVVVGVPAGRPTVVVAVNDAGRGPRAAGGCAGRWPRPVPWAAAAAARTTSRRAAERRWATGPAS